MRPTKEVHDAICKAAADDGKLIDAGFMSYAMMVIPEDASSVQRHECRIAFFAGAQHLFASILSILEPGDNEPTETDLRRMDAINKELNAFTEEYKLKAAKPGGTA